MIKNMIDYSRYWGAIGIVLFAQGVFAAEVQLKRFKAGDVIYAEDVNGNFQTLAEAVKQLQQEVAELKQRNAALQAEIAALKKQPVAPASTNTPQPVTRTSTKTPQYHLRNTPKTVSYTEARQVFGLDQNMRPLQYIANDFERKGDIVIDHATGLMWQLSGSPKTMAYQEAQQYMQQLSQQRFAGYSDWRIPTITELLSLMTKERQTNELFIESVFDANQRWCWSADTHSSVWSVNFVNGDINFYAPGMSFYVRAVRTGQ